MRGLRATVLKHQQDVMDEAVRWLDNQSRNPESKDWFKRLGLEKVKSGMERFKKNHFHKELGFTASFHFFVLYSD